jgi:hypothetical protein
MDLGYVGTADGTTAVVTDKDGTALGAVYKGICYGNIFEPGYSPIPKALKKEEAIYLDVYYNDSVTEHYKGDTTVTTKFLEALETTGLFKNTTVKLIETENAPTDVKAHYKISGKYTLHIRHDIDKASAQEMFLIGMCVRTAANQPQIVDDYVRYLELEPEVDKWKLFVISHAMHYHEKRTESNGHRLVSQFFAMVNEYSLEDFYKRAEHKTPLRKATSYRLTGNNYYETLFVKDVLTQPSDNVFYDKYGVKSLFTGYAKREGVRYSKEALQTFLDEDVFRKSLFTKAFSNKPYLPPPEEKVTKRVDSYANYEANAFAI